MKRTKLYTTQEVAEMLDMTRQHVSLLARKHGLGQMFGSSWMFTPADVKRLEQRPRRGTYARKTS